MLWLKMKKESPPPTPAPPSQKLEETDQVLRVMDRLWKAHDQSDSKMKPIWLQKIEAYKRKVKIK